MKPVDSTIVYDAIITLLTEAYAGPPDPSNTWFIDNAPDSGIFSLLAGVSAREASASVDGSGQPGSTIVGNAEHLRWSLANANHALRGEPFPGNWQESWNMLQTDEARWIDLRGLLRAEFEALCAGLQAQTELPGEYMIGVLALIPHAAFHLGLMRQMIERVRAARNPSLG